MTLVEATLLPCLPPQPVDRVPVPGSGEPKRIAFVLSSLGAGGAERVIATVSAALAEDGADVSVIAFDRPEDPVFHVFDPKVKLVRLGLPPVRGRLAAAWTMARRLAKLRRAFRVGGFDIVVSFLTKVNAVTLAASAGLRIPVIVSERNNPLAQPQHAFWKVVSRRLYPRAAAVVLQTDKSRMCLPREIQDRAVVIRNPASAPAFRPDGVSMKRLVGVGRLTEQKGFDLLIQAFALVAPERPDWELVIWGDGPDRSALEAQVRALGLAGRTSLPGVTPRPGAWVETATALVLSSRFEGSPNVVLEAMAAGIPVIAAACDFGPEEIIDSERDGLLVPPENVDALADAMARIMDDAALRETLGLTGRHRAKAEFSPATILDQWRSLIKSTIARRAEIDVPSSLNVASPSL